MTNVIVPSAGTAGLNHLYRWGSHNLLWNLPISEVSLTNRRIRGLVSFAFSILRKWKFKQALSPGVLTQILCFYFWHLYKAEFKMNSKLCFFHVTHKTNKQTKKKFVRVEDELKSPVAWGNEAYLLFHFTGRTVSWAERARENTNPQGRVRNAWHCVSHKHLISVSLWSADNERLQH